MKRCMSLMVALMIVLPIGCAGRPSLLPNSDPALRKTSAQFAADAAKRFPYKANLPRGGELAGRAEVDYMLDNLTVANLSQDDWENVELWVNQKYVVFVPKMIHGKEVTLPFQMMFDDSGNSIPTSHLKEKITKLEANMNGKMYDIPVRLAD